MRALVGHFLQLIWYRWSFAGWLLWPVSLIYLWLAKQSKARALSRRVAAEQIPPVVVVGNITVGGTGKTPLVILLAQALKKRGLRVGIVSRGYAVRGQVNSPIPVGASSAATEVGDEPLLIARRTDCPVMVAADRVAAVKALAARTELDAVLSDDGLQHYALPRAFEIAVIDGVRGFGNQLCLPAGPLREPAQRLSAVDAVVVNGGKRHWPGAARMRLEPAGIRHLGKLSAERSLADFAGREVHAVAGVGHPERFFALLESHGVKVRRHPRPDHADLDLSDLEFGDGLDVLVTEKDAVKLPGRAHDGIWVVAVDALLERSELEQLLDAVLAAVAQGNCR